jgi:hypothetical protein
MIVMMDRKIKIISAYKKDVFEAEVNSLMEKGFVFKPETFRIATSRDGIVTEYVILMFCGIGDAETTTPNGIKILHN